MSAETAQQVVFVIAAVGGVIWLLALGFLVQSARLPRRPEADGFGEPTASNLLAGSAEVEGDPGALAATAALCLAHGALGPLKIEHKPSDRVVFAKLEEGVGRQPFGRWFRRGELRFTALPGHRTQIDWVVEPAAFRWLLVAGGVVQGLGLAGLVIGCWAIATQVATSPDPAIRWQSLQMLQVGHLLWPPFLFGGLYRKGIRGLVAEFGALASNLPYVGKPT